MFVESSVILPKASKVTWLYCFWKPAAKPASILSTCMSPPDFNSILFPFPAPLAPSEIVWTTWASIAPPLLTFISPLFAITDFKVIASASLITMLPDTLDSTSIVVTKVFKAIALSASTIKSSAIKTELSFVDIDFAFKSKSFVADIIPPIAVKSNFEAPVKSIVTLSAFSKPLIPPIKPATVKLDCKFIKISFLALISKFEAFKLVVWIFTEPEEVVVTSL